MKTQNIIISAIIGLFLSINPGEGWCQNYPSGGYQGGGHGSGGILSNLNEIPFDVDDVILETYPNPFSEKTRLRLILNESSEVKAEVYDITGSLIRSLLPGKKLSPSVYNIEWYGDSNHGSLVPKGVYYFRIRINQHIITKKIIRI